MNCGKTEQTLAWSEAYTPPWCIRPALSRMPRFSDYSPALAVRFLLGESRHRIVGYFSFPCFEPCFLGHVAAICPSPSAPKPPVPHPSASSLHQTHRWTLAQCECRATGYKSVFNELLISGSTISKDLCWHSGRSSKG